MTIEVKNSEVIVRVVKERLRAAGKAFRRALEDEATRLVVRTRKGLDVNGQPLRPYSERYAKFRQKKGRNTDPVDLTFTGNMLAAVQTEVKETPEGYAGRIFFNSAREAAKAAYNQETRPFFGLADEQVQRITDAVQNAK
jgi:phage gpG-like protein